jgi:hypothetical protein
MRFPDSELALGTPINEDGLMLSGLGRETKGWFLQKSPLVSASLTAITSKIASKSLTDRAWGTTTSADAVSGQFPRIDRIPRDGVYATRPLFDAGDRPDETVSSARPNTAMLAAVETPHPLDEPDPIAAARYDALYGLSARPYRPRCMPPFAIGGIFVFPRGMAPAARRAPTVKASWPAVRFWNAGEPAATGRPLIM